MTLISGVPLTGVELDALATRLKKLCGAGGTVRDGVIEIQTASVRGFRLNQRNSVDA